MKIFPDGLQGLTVPPADHLHDGRGEEAHPVRPPLVVVDVSLPTSVYVLLQHLGGHQGSVWGLTVNQENVLFSEVSLKICRNTEGSNIQFSSLQPNRSLGFLILSTGNLSQNRS